MADYLGSLLINAGAIGVDAEAPFDPTAVKTFSIARMRTNLAAALPMPR